MIQLLSRERRNSGSGSLWTSSGLQTTESGITRVSKKPALADHVVAGRAADDSTAQYYEHNALEYARLTQDASLQTERARFAALLPAHALVLDIGCGAGRDLAAFRQHEVNAVGIDQSFALAQIACEFAGSPTVVADIRSLPFAAHSVDAGWAVASLHHLPRHEIAPALREIRRVIKPGGIFFSSVKRGASDGFDGKGRWFTYFTPASWSSTLQAAGFNDVAIELSTALSPRGHAIKHVPWISSFSRA